MKVKYKNAETNVYLCYEENNHQLAFERGTIDELTHLKLMLPIFVAFTSQNKFQF